mmetsp:Transcript_80884/g.127875  ORF Transcript_80884/g.127875 Transcript_80884/m.127875 type:complete len:218 (+) Transcript_80884:1200-1853(+)
MGYPEVLGLRGHLHHSTAMPMVSPITDLEVFGEGVKEAMTSLVPAMQEMLIDEMPFGHHRCDHIIHVSVNHHEHQHVLHGQPLAMLATVATVPLGFIAIRQAMELRKEVADGLPVTIRRVGFDLAHHPRHVGRHKVPDLLGNGACGIAFEIDSPHVLQVLRDPGVSQRPLKKSSCIALRVAIGRGCGVNVQHRPASLVDDVTETPPGHSRAVMALLQ